VSYLLDTNVISELRKGRRAHPRVQAWRESVTNEETFLSVLVFGEIRRGIENLRPRDPQTAGALERWLLSLEAAYADRILPVTLEICRIWGGLSVQQPLPISDALLAATALHHNLTVVTRNITDFERTGVACVNPFLG
jgi:predicted nucleic acid-binding protein